MRALALSVLDLVAHVAAAAASRLSALERPAIKAAHALGTSLAAEAFRRRFFGRYARRLASQGRSLRPLDICSHRVLLDVARPFGFSAHFKGRLYEPEVTHAIAALTPADVFVDVGANEGYFTLLAARAIGGHQRVHAFEPNPVARERLETSLENNGVRRGVGVHAVALTSARGDAALFLSDRGPSFSSLRPQEAPAAAQTFTQSIQVAATTFDAWAEEANLLPTLIKIDVEGGELLVLEGMTETLRRAPGLRIICETPADSPADEFLRRQGFRGSPLGDDQDNRLYVRA
jgi:FkbM family methyltransferase